MKQLFHSSSLITHPTSIKFGSWAFSILMKMNWMLIKSDTQIIFINMVEFKAKVKL